MSDKSKVPSTNSPNGVIRVTPGDAPKVKNGSNNLPTFLNPPLPPPPPSSKEIK